MQLGEMFSSSRRFINKLLWVVCIPVILDIIQLISYQHIYETDYVPIRKLFIIKIGIISSPPSVNFLLEDFPSAIFQYNNSGFKGIINEFIVFNILFMITFVLISSFIHSGYLSVIGGANEKGVGIKEFFIMGNRNWFKFFILQIIQFIPMILIIIKRELIILGFINIIFMYVDYSIVADEGNIRDNFRKGINFLFNNLGLTIKIAFYSGFIFSLLSIPIYFLAGFGIIGIIIDIIIIAYFGTVINRMVLEVYTYKNDSL